MILLSRFIYAANLNNHFLYFVCLCMIATYFILFLMIPQWKWVEASTGIVVDHITISQSADWKSQPWVIEQKSLTSLFLTILCANLIICILTCRNCTLTVRSFPPVPQCCGPGQHQIPHNDPHICPCRPDSRAHDCSQSDVLHFSGTFFPYRQETLSHSFLTQLCS